MVMMKGWSVWMCVKLQRCIDSVCVANILILILLLTPYLLALAAL